MAIDTERRSSRRNLLAAGAGAFAGLAALAIGRPAPVAAVANGDVQLGHGVHDGDNDSADETRVNGTTNGVIALSGAQNGSGTGLYGLSDSGRGVDGQANSGTGVWAESFAGAGARAENTSTTPTLDFSVASNKSGAIGTAGNIGTPGDPNAIAKNTDETGVYGYSNMSSNSAGVWGDTWDGAGVYGSGSAGVAGNGYYGVYGYGHFGIYGQAANATSYGLYTTGKIKFAGRSGRTSITSGHGSKNVSISGMTSSSAVIATLQTRKSGFSLAAAVSHAGYFTLYLNKTATSTMYISYLVIG